MAREAERLVAFRLTDADLIALKAAAEHRGASVSEVIRSALRSDRVLPSQRGRKVRKPAKPT